MLELPPSSCWRGSSSAPSPPSPVRSSPRSSATGSRRSERGRIYGFVLAGETLGAGFGFAVTGDIAAALVARRASSSSRFRRSCSRWLVLRLREPERGGRACSRHTRPHPLPTRPRRTSRRRPTRSCSRASAASSPTRSSSSAATCAPRRPLAGRALRAARAHEPHPDRSERVRLLLPRRRADVRPEFAQEQYGIDQALANLLLLVVGGGRDRSASSSAARSATGCCGAAG